MASSHNDALQLALPLLHVAQRLFLMLCSLHLTVGDGTHEQYAVSSGLDCETRDTIWLPLAAGAESSLLV